ncbi:hypothetical protein ACFX1Q_020184 [Malus domestica]
MQPLHSTELRTRRGKLRNQRGICFSKRVSACHMHTQLCGNHRQFVEAPISDIEEALAFPDVLAPVTCTLSLAEIMGNLSKISCEVECTTRRKRVISQHLVSIFRSETDYLEPLPDCLPRLALEYSSSTSYASSSSTTSAWGTYKGSENDTSKHKKQAEKNANYTIKSTQQKESDLKPRNSDIPRSEFQTSSRSKLWKVNNIIYLQNHICVLKLYSVWFLLCHTCLVYLFFVCLLVFV